MRRIVLSTLISALVISAGVYFLRPVPLLKQRPSRVVLIVVDTLRHDFVSPYGAPASLTPVLDELSKKSVLFAQTIAAAPWTLPSVSSILTSLYPSFHQVTGKFEPWIAEMRNSGKISRLAEGIPTLGELLRGAGYRTYAANANAWLNPVSGIFRGVDEYSFVRSRTDRDVFSLGLKWFSAPDALSFIHLHVMGPHGPYVCPAEEVEALMPLYASSARPVPELEQQGERFFAQSGSWAPPEMKRNVAFWKACYAAGVRRADRNLGEFLDVLQKDPAWQDTLLIVVADHGEELFDQGSFRHGRRLNASVLNIPLLVRLPGDLLGGSVIKDPVSHIDLLPTVLELVHARNSIPAHAQGLSLVPLMRQEKIEPRALFASGVMEMPDALAIIHKGDRFIRGDGGFSPRLFDSARDPQERVPLEAPLVTAEMEKLAEKYQSEVKQFGQAGNFSELSKSQIQQLKTLGYLN